jgi:hypothetical protein
MQSTFMRLNWKRGGFLFRTPQHNTFEYHARYYDPEREVLENKKQRIRFRAGQMANSNAARNLAGKMRRNRVAGYSRRNAGAQNTRTMLLAGMLLVTLLYMGDQINLIFALPFIFVLMLLFIHKSKQP